MKISVTICGVGKSKKYELATTLKIRTFLSQQTIFFRNTSDLIEENCELYIFTDGFNRLLRISNLVSLCFKLLKKKCCTVI